jgi:ATP-dependent exoDNAse (exonuclease V) beta subunit
MTVHGAKGLEFPVVILPEVQAPLSSSGHRRFVADEEEGLDVNVGELEDVLQTRSASFWRRLNVDKTASLFEEMRVFYVAVTRAQNHVVLVGDAREAPCGPADEAYGWQDEVLAAWPTLAALGARKTGER